MPSYRDAKGNLIKYSDEVSKLTLQLYNQVNDTLKKLIVNNDIGLAEAQRKLLKEYNKALVSTDFIEKFKAGTVKVIVQSSYVSGAPAKSKQAWGNYLWNKSLFDDNIKLSSRIRNNAIDIIAAQKKVLRTSLKGGKTISQIVGNIGEDTLKGFTRELPKYIKEIKDVNLTQNFYNKKGKLIKVKGQKISHAQIRAVKNQAKRIKTAGLRVDYLRLIDAIELGKNVDNAVFFAMERKTKYFAERLARSETIRTLAVQRNHEAVQDPDTQYVKNITQGNNPCPYCVATEDIGFVPVGNASIATHHPNCSCRAEYKRTTKRPESWSNAEYKGKLQASIDKQNKKAEKNGTNKTYIEPQTPVNLRGAGDLLSNYPDS
jgi:hypothetical protein